MQIISTAQPSTCLGVETESFHQLQDAKFLQGDALEVQDMGHGVDW